MLGILNPVVGDVNQDGMVNDLDIDRLSLAIRQSEDDSIFDLNGDDLVTFDDRNMLIEQILHTFLGDSNLDGEFNSSDFVTVFQAGEYEDEFELNSLWKTGDWDGDGDFSTSDFVNAFQSNGYEQGPRDPLAITVPEPRGLVILAFLSIHCFRNFQRRRWTS